MIELFKNPRIEWIRSKRLFIPVSIILLVLGAVAVEIRGFNLGVDFAGGTIMSVRFSQPASTDNIRSVLAEGGIDTTKVTIQSDIAKPNELLIRAPQISGSETEQRLDQDKRAIIRALQKLNPAGEEAAGKINLNVADGRAIEQELQQGDPLAIKDRTFSGEHPYTQVGDQVANFRNAQRFLTSKDAIQSLNLTVDNFPEFDQAKVKAFLMERFYAGKIDLNLAGESEIQDALIRVDPLGVSSQAGAVETYKKASVGISNYKKQRNGVIGSLEEIQIQDVSADLLAKMAPYFMTGSWAVISADVVGPQVGRDLQERAIYVTLAALAGMLVYIAFRFEWIYGVAAVVAVFHDVLVTLGLFSLFNWEISLTVVASLLTLIGYSMNDTIVIFDRIRENLRLRRRDNLAQIANDSINQTLSRTIITQGLTFISVVCIVLFGGEVLRGFALALTIGIIVGTYSSVAVASPIMLWWQYRTGGQSGRGAAVEGRSVRSRPAERTLAKV